MIFLNSHNRQKLRLLKKFIVRTLKPKFLYFGVRVKPASLIFGFDRGTPVDRYYLNSYLKIKSQYIVGSVAEIGDNDLSLKYGNKDIKSTVLVYGKAMGNNQISCDLTRHETLPTEEFDTFICTQTLNFVYDFEKALEGIVKTIKPGGSLLLSVAGLSQISEYDMNRWGDYWRFTSLTVEKLLSKYFKKDSFEVVSFGNAYTASGFLYGVSAEEISSSKLKYQDKNYQIIICAHAVKS